MKILHVLDHSLPVHTGYTFRTRNILKQQLARGWQTAQLTGSKHPLDGPDPETVDGLLFHRTRGHGSLSARIPVLNQLGVTRGLSRRLDAVIEQERPDILHAHSPALDGLAALAAGRRHALPVLYECRAFWEDAAVDHGTTSAGSLRYRLTRWLETYVFRHADAVTCICEGLRADIVARGVSQDRVTVIPNAVDIESFGASAGYDQQLASSIGVAGKPVIGFLGSFYAYEGLDLAIEALPRMRAQIPDLVLLLVGGGPQESNLKVQSERLGLTDSVIFTGRVPHDQVQRYYDLVDILVYPRHAMRLTDLVTPLKPLEAMAQRRVLVASDVGGHRELIVDGLTGRLFKAGDKEAFADAVVDMFAKRDQWDGFRRAGREFVEKERNWQASVARYRPVYERLVRT
ncbi:MAG: glycosyltransferase, exosortase A system-associated [Gammaproteobacteria bacterium]|nr:glycosyltransferase, exosortase A system-associated [Gammaproteobacteria bacterium]